MLKSKYGYDAPANIPFVSTLIACMIRHDCMYLLRSNTAKKLLVVNMRKLYIRKVSYSNLINVSSKLTTIYYIFYNYYITVRLKVD